MDITVSPVEKTGVVSKDQAKVFQPIRRNAWMLLGDGSDQLDEGAAVLAINPVGCVRRLH
jgi:hypothetical protein